MRQIHVCNMCAVICSSLSARRGRLCVDASCTAAKHCCNRLLVTDVRKCSRSRNTHNKQCIELSWSSIVRMCATLRMDIVAPLVLGTTGAPHWLATWRLGSDRRVPVRCIAKRRVDKRAPVFHQPHRCPSFGRAGGPGQSSALHCLCHQHLQRIFSCASLRQQALL